MKKHDFFNSLFSYHDEDAIAKLQLLQKWSNTENVERWIQSTVDIKSDLN